MAISYGPNLGLMVNATTGEAHDAALRAFLRGVDGLVMPAVLDKDLNTPPGSPVSGDRYIVGPSPMGAWAGNAGKIARWSGSAWEFYTPSSGWRVMVVDEGVEYRYLSGAWTAQVKVGDGTATTSATSGDLVVVGGIGVGGNAQIGGSIVAGAGGPSADRGVHIRAAAGYQSQLFLSSGLSNRWAISRFSGAETGSDAGSAFAISAYNDAGVLIDNPIFIVRAAGGAITMSRPVSINNTTASTSTTSGALTVSGGLGVAGAVFIGGLLNVAAGVKVNGIQVLGAQGAAVADASGGSVIDVEARAALNALLARLRAHGIIAT